MHIDHSLETQRRAKNPLQKPTRVGRWFFRLKDLARRTWAYRHQYSKGPSGGLFITDTDLIRLAALVSIIGDTDDPMASEFTVVLRDLFFTPWRCRQVMAAVDRIPADRDSLIRMLEAHRAYTSVLVDQQAARPFGDARFVVKNIVTVMARIENPTVYMHWVRKVSNEWKRKLNPARVFSALYDRYQESPAGLEEARAGTADPETDDAVRRIFE